MDKAKTKQNKTKQDIKDIQMIIKKKKTVEASNNGAVCLIVRPVFMIVTARG